MSLKLFIASYFGLIKSTAKIENDRKALLADYQLFNEFEKSNELKEYHELDLLVNSPTFKQKKKELQNLTYKGSREEAQMKELGKLGKNRNLTKFYITQKSDELKRFGKLTESGLAERYAVLKSFVEGPEFQKKKKNAKGKSEFETTEAFAKLVQFKELQSSDDIKFFLSFQKSAALRNYEKMKDSPERKRLEELQKITDQDEFRSRVIYLEDKQKWEKTEDSVKEKRFEEMQKTIPVINYLKYKNSNAFDFFKKWELVFEDNFEADKLDQEKWSTQSHWAAKTLGQNFSQVGDLHAFTEGKNVSTGGNSLKIEVRKEKVKGMAWQLPFGFVEQEFDYSSGLVSTAGNEWWNHGILEAKVKYAPSKHMVDAIYLLGEESSPQINLLEMGVKNRVGVLTKNEKGILSDCEGISGLKTGEFYIFRLEWSSQSLIWKINNKEVLTINLHVPSHTMHLNAASIVVSEPNGSLPHRFEIDWVRFYQHHKA